MYDYRPLNNYMLFTSRKKSNRNFVCDIGMSSLFPLPFRAVLGSNQVFFFFFIDTVLSFSWLKRQERETDRLPPCSTVKPLYGFWWVFFPPSWNDAHSERQLGILPLYKLILGQIQ